MKQIEYIHDFLSFFAKKLRLSNPWNYKAPFLICIPYLLFLLSGYSGENATNGIIASLVVIIGVAGFGYLSNDLGDKSKDAAAGKENVAAQLSVTGLVFLFACFLAMAILPWFYLPIDKVGGALLALEFFLFCIYALPPLRLKEKGFPGVVTDALYAHVNPGLLAAYTFYLYTAQKFSHFFDFILLLSMWQLFLGIRNILFHQLKDYDNDMHSGTRTFTTKYGVEKTIRILTKIFLPAEVVSFLLLAIFITFYQLLFLPAVLLYFIVAGTGHRKILRSMGFRQFAYIFLDDLYINWVPLIVLSGLAMHSVHYLVLCLLHIIIFKNGIKGVIMKYF